MIAWLAASALAVNPSVLLIHASDPVFVSDVQSKLQSEGLTRVGTFDARSATPTGADLAPWDAVLIWADGSWRDRTLLGDRLAAYADAGRGVVVANFALVEQSQPGGRFLPYVPILPSSQAGGAASLVVVDAASPLLAGVSSLSVPGPSYVPGATPAAGSHVVAAWDQGAVMVTEWSVDGAATVVGLNLFPPSEDAYVFGWDPATDGATLMVNSLTFAADNRGTPVASELRGWAHGVCNGLVWLHAGMGQPASREWFAAGLPGGQSVIPAGVCAGTVVPLRNVGLLATLTADAAGNAELATFLPANTCGAQAVVVERDTCTVSPAFLLP